jgi:hypothetical protein
MMVEPGGFFGRERRRGRIGAVVDHPLITRAPVDLA